MRPLRKWQREAVDTIVNQASHGLTQALIYACPASGKTYAGLNCLVELRDMAGKSNKSIIAVPTIPIKDNWIFNCAEVGLNLIKIDKKTDLLTDDMFSGGFVVTYSQLSSMQDELRRFSERYNPIALLDEVHHTEASREYREGNIWGQAAERVFGPASFVLSTTGTPFRLGKSPIPFVGYTPGGEVIATVRYRYREAIGEGVCRPVYFTAYGNPGEHMEWTDRRGVSVSADFAEELNERQSRERLTAAISMNGALAKRMLFDANRKLDEIRLKPGGERAAGVVVCNRHQAAEEAAKYMTSIAGETAILVHDDIPNASAKIVEFRQSNLKWIIGVGMLTEGIDIPRLRVGVYCSNIRAPLSLIQFFGRVMRQETEGAAESSFIYLVSDPDIMKVASEIQGDVSYALGDDVPINEDLGRSGPARRGRRDGIVVHDSKGTPNAIIYDVFVVPFAYLQEHEAAISAMIKKLPWERDRVQVAITLSTMGKLPPLPTQGDRDVA